MIIDRSSRQWTRIFAVKRELALFAWMLVNPRVDLYILEERSVNCGAFMFRCIPLNYTGTACSSARSAIALLATQQQ